MVELHRERSAEDVPGARRWGRVDPRGGDSTCDLCQRSRCGEGGSFGWADGHVSPRLGGPFWNERPLGRLWGLVVCTSAMYSAYLYIPSPVGLSSSPPAPHAHTDLSCLYR